MERNKVKFFIEFMMIITFVAVTATGFNHNIDTHKSAAIFLLFLLVIHLVLNRLWIKHVFLSFFKKN